MIEILIVDDRAVVREELRNVLSLTGLVHVAGEAGDGWDALRLAETLDLDIVLMDLEMPGLDGFEATRQIKRRGLSQAVIAFSVYADAANRRKALDAGADAFVVKGTDLRTLLDLFEQFAHRPRDYPGKADERQKGTPV